MKKFAKFGVLGAAGLALAACGGSDNRSDEAAPESVEMPAQEALDPIAEEPVADAEAVGPAPAEEPAIDPASRAPDPVTTEETADRAVEVADRAVAAAEEAAAAAEAAEAAAAALPIE